MKEVTLEIAIAGLHVGKGFCVGALTVFPIWRHRANYLPRRYVTSSDSLVFAELDSGPEVETLGVQNKAEHPAFVADGQLFEGGWQHRMALRSYLVPAGQSELINVACVEQGRWGAGSTEQWTFGRRASTLVRAGADLPLGQEEVWRRVQGYGTDSPSGSLLPSLRASENQAKLVIRHAGPLMGQVGVLIGVGGQPLVIEVFDHPQTLREQFPHIVRAAALDALGLPSLPTPGALARSAIASVVGMRVAVDSAAEGGPVHATARSSQFDVAALLHRMQAMHVRANCLAHPILQAA